MKYAPWSQVLTGIDLGSYLSRRAQDAEYDAWLAEEREARLEREREEQELQEEQDRNL